MKITVQMTNGLCCEATDGTHTIVVDEPEGNGGEYTGLSPKQLVAVSLGTCTVMTLKLYTQRKDWPLECAAVTVTYEPADAKAGTPHRFLQEVALTGPLDEAQRARLLQISGRCPVHKILEGPTEFEERLVEPLCETEAE